MKKDKLESPIAIWTGYDRVADEVLKSVTIIVRSGGCSWNRCLMCQYRHERLSGVSEEELIRLMSLQLDALASSITEQNPSLVKLYTSGSFFDKKEVPEAVREMVIRLCKGRLLTVECRADYIDPDVIAESQRQLRTDDGNGGLIVAIGLETSSDSIREKCIDKGITFQDYIRASESIRKGGALVKTYLLHKPGYLTEREAFEDMIASVRDIIPYTDLISMNPCSIQGRTSLEKLWKQGTYRPPYLWSIARVLAESDVHITCDP
jgi:radical SAM enzyme (TIGR01210 family)